MNSKDEYLMLRDELIHLESMVNNTINFFYAFLVSYLAFACLQSDTIYILFSYIIILPAYIIVISKMEGMARIGAYLCVFHEGETFNWEKRNLEFKRIREKKHFTYIVSSNFPFVITNYTVFIILLYQTSWNQICTMYEILKLLIGMGLFALTNVLYWKNRRIGTNDFVDYWQQIKITEQKI